MYLDFYGLKESPFSITPDPRFVFLTEKHRDALAHLLYGVGQEGSGGFVQLTGEVGTGKTTLSRLLLEQLPQNTRVALLLNPKVTPLELLETLTEELKVPLTDRRSSKDLIDALNQYLLDAYGQGLRVVLLIDEAQNLSAEALEQVRLLTNLETATQKLLQIILLGQPELRDKLALPELRQLSQRITARYHLMPLDEAETESYLRHRFLVAGSKRFAFSRLAVRAIHRASGGVPRLINVIADRALLAGYVGNEEQVSESHVTHAASEVKAHVRQSHLNRLVFMIGILGLCLLLVGWFFLQTQKPSITPTPILAAALPEIENVQNNNPVLLDLLKTLPAQSDVQAWQELLQLWQIDPSGLNWRLAMRCPRFVAAGISCLRSGGNLAKLQALNRPVLLVLRYAQRSIIVALVGINDTSVQLVMNSTSVRFKQSELEKLWLGEYIALWKQPAFIGDRLPRDAVGEAKSWVEQQLARFEQKTADQQVSMSNMSIEDRLRQLQVRYGLLPDGIIGPETLLALSSLEPDGPHLNSNF
jgi:general secretion pathway protein A